MTFADAAAVHGEQSFQGAIFDVDIVLVQVGAPPASPGRLAGRVVVPEIHDVPDDGVDGVIRAVGIQFQEHVAERG
jgi:hypothetical protein